MNACRCGNCVIDRDRMPLCRFNAFGGVFRRTNTFVCVVLQLIIVDANVGFLAASAVAHHHVVQLCVSWFFRIVILAFVCVIQFIFLGHQIAIVLLKKRRQKRD